MVNILQLHFYHFPLKSYEHTTVGHRLGNSDLCIEQYIILYTTNKSVGI